MGYWLLKTEPSTYSFSDLVAAKETRWDGIENPAALKLMKSALTGDRWMPGTMIQMTLQKPCAQGERKQSMNVLSRIVRRGSDGVAIEFVMPEALSHIGHDIQPSQATDKFALARFL